MNNKKIKDQFKKETGRDTLRPPSHDPADQLQPLDILWTLLGVLVFVAVLYLLLFS